MGSGGVFPPPLPCLNSAFASDFSYRGYRDYQFPLLPSQAGSGLIIARSISFSSCALAHLSRLRPRGGVLPLPGPPPRPRPRPRSFSRATETPPLLFVRATSSPARLAFLHRTENPLAAIRPLLHDLKPSPRSFSVNRRPRLQLRLPLVRNKAAVRSLCTDSFSCATKQPFDPASAPKPPLSTEPLRSPLPRSKVSVERLPQSHAQVCTRRRSYLLFRLFFRDHHKLFIQTIFETCWGVGFLKYFEVKQLPNFLLASPILTISIASVIYYASLLQQSLHSFRITSDPHGKGHSGEIISLDNSSTSLEFKGNHDLQRRKSENKPKSSENFHFVEPEIDSFIKFRKGYCSVLVFPFILHLGFLSFMALFVMHVQVATRFLSASPPIYWFASYLVLSPGTTSRRIGYLIWSYSIAYILLGSLLFSNFYPFT